MAYSTTLYLEDDGEEKRFDITFADDISKYEYRTLLKRIEADPTMITGVYHNNGTAERIDISGSSNYFDIHRNKGRITVSIHA